MSTRKPQEFATFPPALQAGYGPYRAVVRHVVDGDTLDVLIDLGLNAYTYETLRVRGIDCPERQTPAGKAAQAYVRELLPPGTPVLVTTHKDAQTFGRYVADVRFLRDDVAYSLAPYLVAQGLAS